MGRRNGSENTKQRILAACVRLFLEKGYANTKLTDIQKEANVSIGSFQNLFRTKDGVLTEFVGIMLAGQFGAARGLAADTPAHVYAVETALQLALTETSENLRDIYIEAYTYPETLELIHRYAAAELQNAFGAYLPEFTESDFYEMELGTSGMMRGFMTRRCDTYFTLERKIRRFLEMSLSVFRVPESEQTQIFACVAEMDLRAEVRKVMDALFKSLSMQFELVGA